MRSQKLDDLCSVKKRGETFVNSAYLKGGYCNLLYVLLFYFLGGGGVYFF